MIQPDKDWTPGLGGASPVGSAPARCYWEMSALSCLPWVGTAGSSMFGISKTLPRSMDLCSLLYVTGLNQAHHSSEYVPCILLVNYPTRGWSWGPPVSEVRVGLPWWLRG